MKIAELRQENDETIRENGPIVDAYKRLLTAVLARAVCDVVLELSNLSQHDKRESRAWLFSDDNGPFTAKWVCDHLGLDTLDEIRAFVRSAGAAKKLDGFSFNRGASWTEEARESARIRATVNNPRRRGQAPPVAA